MIASAALQPLTTNGTLSKDSNITITARHVNYTVASHALLSTAFINTIRAWLGQRFLHCLDPLVVWMRRRTHPSHIHRSGATTPYPAAVRYGADLGS
jgi:hypothetical protein